MFATILNTRRKRILQAIVEKYIQTALPVSSQAIAQHFRSRISSATVRNTMAELDDLGLIWQPHTSAGRIPTDKGYRYYIDSLLELECLTYHEIEFIKKQYLARSGAFDELLREILRILSNFSGYTALAFYSGLRKILFKRLEFVSVETTKLLVVLVSQEGLIKTSIIQMPFKIEQQELFRIARFLNEEFRGLTLDEIKSRLSQRLFVSSDTFFYLVKNAARILNLAFINFEKDRLYLEGTSCILEQPEFKDTQKLQAIIRTFEQQELLLSIMKKDLGAKGVKVHIGTENPYKDIQDCSLVVSNFKIRNINIGTLGVIGPRRMAYSKVISTVDYVSRFLGERIANEE